MRVVDEAVEGRALDVLSLVGDVDLPLPDLIRLELGRVDAIGAGDRAVQGPVQRRVGRYDDPSVTRLRRVDLKTQVRSGQGRAGHGRTGQGRADRVGRAGRVGQGGAGR